MCLAFSFLFSLILYIIYSFSVKSYSFLYEMVRNASSFLIGSTLLLGLLGLGFGIGKLNWRNQKGSRRKKRKLNDCIFFAPLRAQCKSFKDLNKKTSCGSLICSYCSYNKLINYIDSANNYIDVCVYLLTSEEICDSLIRLLKNDVHVRLIVDKQMSDEADGATLRLKQFRKECMPIKVVETSKIMHNKFVIIDREIVITGSCNWTMQALSGNFENAVITNNAEIVKKFLQYFEELWNDKHETF